MSEIFGPSVAALETALRQRVQRQGALASNVANADTPGYRRVDLEFGALLEDAGLRLERTDPQHLGPDGSPSGEGQIVRGPRGTRLDGNGVDLQQELVELSRNAGAFEEQATVLARLLALRRLAVAEENR